jgi:ADP-ribose pyrophosphatase YjhB (NUDIX family)
MLKFCSTCGQPVRYRIPADDQRPRAVCTVCGTVHYENPRLVIGCVPVWQGRILLCRRAIEPRLGFWTVPAGFHEIGETVKHAAARETLEEAMADVEIGSLLAVVEVLHAGQVHLFFRAQMRTAAHGIGAESLEVALCEPSAIPWPEIAFPSVTFALQQHLKEPPGGGTGVHYLTV